MQIKIKQETKVFKPVALELTFESKNELELFQTMCSYDLNIPNMVYPKDRENNLNLMRLLGDIHDMIVEIQGA